MTRQEILDRAFTRESFPGTRRLSSGLLSLARQLGLQFAVGKEKKRDLEEAEREMEGIAIAWLLDADVTLPFVRTAMSHGREFVFAEILPEYGMSLHPLKLRYAQREVAMTNEELAASEYSIEPKPDDKPGDTPSGNS